MVKASVYDHLEMSSMLSMDHHIKKKTNCLLQNKMLMTTERVNLPSGWGRFMQLLGNCILQTDHGGKPMLMLVSVFYIHVH